MIFFRICRFCFIGTAIFVLLKFPLICKKNKAKYFVMLLKKGGPTCVKLGQSLAVRADIVGEVFARHLCVLQDTMPAFSSLQVEEILWESFGKYSKDIFKHFEPVPVAAASIAQVHRAVTKSGRKVAVKILRPHMEVIFSRDIKTFYAMAKILEILPSFRRLRLVDSIREMEKWVREEMDLTLEARNAKKLAWNFAQEKDFLVPAICDSLTTRRVLTMDWVEGVRIDDVKACKKMGLNSRDILRKATRIFFLQVFRDGFFHADMHPGNMFVSDKGVLMPVDFGIMGRLSKKTRMYVADVLYYTVIQEYKRVAQVHFTAGYVPSTYSLDAFAKAIETIDKNVRQKGDWAQISFGRLLTDLFTVTRKFNMCTRPELLLLQKTIIVAEGVGRTIAPKENMWMMIRPTMEGWMRVNRGVTARVHYFMEQVWKNISKTSFGKNSL